MSTGGRLVDERNGSFRGARLGDGLHEVLTHFEGVKRRWTDKAATLAQCGSFSLGAQPGSAPLRTASFEDVVLKFGGTPSRLDQIAAEGRGTRTRAGVAIGDDLDTVKTRYRDSAVQCGREHGTDETFWRSCNVTSGPFNVYFGGDPINRIELQRGP